MPSKPKRLVPILRAPLKPADWDRLLYQPTDDEATRRTVARIVREVRAKGDAALLAAARRFDGVRLDAASLRIPPEVLQRCWEELDPAVRDALSIAKDRIERFHREQMREDWTLADDAGFRLSQRWSALDSVGLYVPGGAAAYPSSVLMNAIPALVAGVGRIVAATPPKRDPAESRATLGALHLCGIEEVYQAGGAQAVAALAHGTESIPRVDKVVGPGNRFVAEAKRMLYGTIDIDMVAGPSEVLILADDSAPLDWIAADMLAQAEHDPDAQAVAVLVGRDDAEALAEEVAAQVARAPRRTILERSLADHGAIIAGLSREEAIDFANRKAAEHLELLLRRPREAAARIRHAGSIFVGGHSVEAIGDYIAGPNHVLPTGGSARFFSPLSVQDFLKLTQIVEASAKGLRAVGPHAVAIALQEGLDAHAESILRRLRPRPRR